jgi:hypothetical protein
MNKTVLVGLAILMASTSAASGWTDRTEESPAMKQHASARAMNAYAAMPAVSHKAPKLTNRIGKPVTAHR